MARARGGHGRPAAGRAGDGRVPAAAGHFADLVAFLCQLVRDPNFKISISAMHLLEALFRRAADQARHHVETAVDILVEKLGDSKHMVRAPAQAVFRAMLERIGPQCVLARLPAKSTHYSWRVREEIINIYILTMLAFPAVPLDWTATAALMLARMDDSKERVRAAAVEGLAVLAARLPAPRLANVLAACSCAPASRQRAPPLTRAAAARPRRQR